MAINDQLERIIIALDYLNKTKTSGYPLSIEDRVYTISNQLQQLVDSGFGELPIHVCTAEEYDPETGIPTVENPEENTFYLVPNVDPEDPNMFMEYIYTGDHWELFGSGGQGVAGVGIASVAKTGTTGKIDTYTITFTDGTTTTYQIANGADGANVTIEETLVSGEDYAIDFEGTGVSPVESVAGKTGVVVLDGGDVGYNSAATYANGTIGKAVQGLDENLFDLQQDVDGLGGNNIPLDSTDVESETIKAAVDDLKTEKVDKAALDNAGITARAYTELFGGEFTVTTAETSGWENPYARASVTGRIAKEYLHRVAINGNEYILSTKLWYEKKTEGFKVYEYLGNLGLYLDDISDVPGDIDNVPFIIISDLDNNSSLDILTNTAGAYTISVERISPTQTLLPNSLIYGDAYSPIKRSNNGGTYEGVSIGVNSLGSSRGTIAIGYGNSISKQFGVTIGSGNTVSNEQAVAIGYQNTSSGIASFSSGIDTTASGAGSHAEGNNTKATGGNSHAEGSGTTAGGALGSHAEGFNSTASGMMSHAEGGMTTASGLGSHAEGQSNTASGANAHAEGNGTTASGSQSHSAGNGTIANHLAQLAYGQYNVADASNAAATARGTYVEIVGNGTADNARSNARTLDWSGNEELAGSITLGKGTADEVTLSAAQLKQLLALLN